METTESRGGSRELVLYSRSDLLRWFELMRNVTTTILTRSTRTLSNVIQQQQTHLMAHVNVLNRIMRSIDDRPENRRKMSPDQWGEGEEGNLHLLPASQQISPPTKPPKPEHFKLPQQETVTRKLELFRSESQEMSYRVLEATTYLHEQQLQQQGGRQEEGIYLSDPLTRHELMNRKLNRQWWTSHSQLLTTPPPAIIDDPLDPEQYDLCLQHFSYFFHQMCRFSRRRSLDLARYFIQLGYSNEMRLREVIERNTIDWLYDVLSNESHEMVNQLICQEIEMISNGLQKTVERESVQTERWSVKTEISDDEWDDRLMKLTGEKELQSTATDLLSSIQEQFSNLQQDLQQIDNVEIPGTEQKSSSETADNLLILTQNLHHLVPSIEIPYSPSESHPPSTPDTQTLEAIYAIDQKLSMIATGMYSLYHQMDSMGIHVNGIHAELLKHENMLTSLLTEEYRVPKYAIIVPVEELSIQSFHSVSCP
jgi:hypothetical protein